VLGESRASVSFDAEQSTIMHADVQEPPKVLDEAAELVSGEAVRREEGLCYTFECQQ
jgi:hypothetical protein